MISQLSSEDPSAALVGVANSVGQKTGLLSLAGDALSLAMTALRLTDPTSVKSGQQPSSDLVTSCPTITLDQVSWHDHAGDCWVVVYDRVYDITSFLCEHPGGEEILLEYAGRDATMAFRGIGHGAAMMTALEPYLLGILPESERIFSNPCGKLSGFKIC